MGKTIFIKEALTDSLLESIFSTPQLDEPGDVTFSNYYPTPGDVQMLNKFFIKYPSWTYRVFFLDDLQYLPDAQSVSLSLGKEEMNHYAESLKYLHKLVSLEMRYTYGKLDISPLLAYKDDLKHFFLEGDVKKGGEEIISQLHALKSAAFSSSKFTSFDFLSGLPIEKLYYYGSRTVDYQDLGNLKNMKWFYLKTNTKWENFDFIESLDNIEEIRLWYCSGIKKFPRCEHLKHLKLVEAIECNKLEDVAELRKLKHSSVVACGRMLVENDQVISLGHVTPPPHIGL